MKYPDQERPWEQQEDWDWGEGAMEHDSCWIQDFCWE